VLPLKAAIECLQHSAKPQIHSAKALASAALGNGHSGKKMASKAAFAESHLSGTRQSFCRVPRQHSAKKTSRHGVGNGDGGFAECQPGRHSAKFFIFFKFFAERRPGWHSAKFFIFIFFNFFAERRTGGSRQSFLFFFEKKFFAECRMGGTQQSFLFF